MSWGNPWMLLALVLPLLGIVGIRRLMRKPPVMRWPAMKRVAVSGNRVRAALPRKMRPAFLVMAAIALAIIAAARPQWGEHDEAAIANTREVIIALDLSHSMLTEDVSPSRLEIARTVTEQLLNSLNGESVGLVVFAGTAFVQVPLSPDYQIIREFMPSLDTNYLPQGGSDYARMLDSALEGFSETPDRDRYLIVLSDGESSVEGWESRLDAMTKRDIHVLSIGVGTDKGAFVPDQQGGFRVNADGDPVHSKLMPATLQALAKRSNGVYMNANTLKDDGDVRALLAKTVETGRKGRVNNQGSLTRTERFQWFLLPAVLLGLLSLSREFQRRPQPRQVRREPAGKTPGGSSGNLHGPAVGDSRGDAQGRPRLPNAAPFAAALTLAVGLGAGLSISPRADAHFDSDAGFEVKQVFESNPAQRVRQIAEHLAKYDYDAFDLELLVQESIKYGLDIQRTGGVLSEGVLKDAIEAARQGEKLDRSLADWGYYRSQLATMLTASGKTEEKEESLAQNAVMDEEDNRPMVIGENSQSFANDSFGEGASAKSDAALGDLTPSEKIEPQRNGRKPPPPKQVKVATSSRTKPGGGEAEDPIVNLTRQRLDEAARRDSPGRLHQLMSESTKPQTQSNNVDW